MVDKDPNFFDLYFVVLSIDNLWSGDFNYLKIILQSHVFKTEIKFGKSFKETKINGLFFHGNHIGIKFFPNRQDFFHMQTKN